MNTDSNPITQIRETDTSPRCQSCNKMLAYEVTRPYSIKCNRCGYITVAKFK